MIEKDKTFSLTIDERVNFARPSIDVLFESANMPASAIAAVQIDYILSLEEIIKLLIKLDK